jgi:hypothetical protein
VNLGHGPGGLLQALAHRLLGVLHERHAVLEPPVHLRGHLLELHGDGGLELAEALPHVPLEPDDLLVDRGPRDVLVAMALAPDARDVALEQLERGLEALRARVVP